MSKVTLEFNTYEPEEKMELIRALKADDMANMLFEITRNGRKIFERKVETLNTTEKEDEMYLKAIDDVFDWIIEQTEEHGIIIDDLLH